MIAMISGDSVWIVLGTPYRGAMALDVAVRRGIGTIARTYILTDVSDSPGESRRYRIAIMYLAVWKTPHFASLLKHDALAHKIDYTDCDSHSEKHQNHFSNDVLQARWRPLPTGHETFNPDYSTTHSKLRETASFLREKEK